MRARTARPFAVNLIPAATNPVLLEPELNACRNDLLSHIAAILAIHDQ